MVMQGQIRRVTRVLKETIKKRENGYQGTEIMCSEARYADKKHHTGQQD